MNKEITIKLKDEQKNVGLIFCFNLKYLYNKNATNKAYFKLRLEKHKKFEEIKKMIFFCILSIF